MRNRAYRRHQRERKRKRMVKLEEICHYPYPAHPMCMDEHGRRIYHLPWNESPVLYYKRVYRSKGKGDAIGYRKRISNRRVRKNQQFGLKGANYKKVYNFWWILY